eukprot:scaffold17225_cov59-Phaeocystis_antarctica.AAC.2
MSVSRSAAGRPPPCRCASVSSCERGGANSHTIVLVCGAEVERGTATHTQHTQRTHARAARGESACGTVLSAQWAHRRGAITDVPGRRGGSHTLSKYASGASTCGT